MSITIEFPGISTAEANVEAAELLELLAFQGVTPEQTRENEESLDAGSLVTVAMSKIPALAKAIFNYLLKRPSRKLKLKSKGQSLELEGYDAKDVAKILGKIEHFLESQAIHK